MALSDLRIDPARGLGLSVDGVCGGPSLLIEISRGVLQGHARGGSSAAGFGEHLELAEVQIAVVLPAGAFVGEGVVGQYFEANGGDVLQLGARSNDVGVLLLALASREQ